MDRADQFDLAMVAIKRHFDNEEWEQTLPLCAKAAEAQPDAEVVRRCRVYALLQLSRWNDSLQVCDKALANGEDFVFERAYCLYRLNRFQDALATLKSDNSDDWRRERLEAQVRYRMGDYDDCAAMYEKLYEEDKEDIGLLVNAAAARVSSGNPREAMTLLTDQEDLLESSYELSFNLACALIEVGKLAEAETRLEDAKQLCIKELMEAENISEEDAATLEDHEELAAIQVQRGLVLQRRGGTAEANELYSRVLTQRAGQSREVDITVLAVACNNVVALRSEGKSLFDSLKRINVASKESLEHKLTLKQTIEIGVNKCLLLLQARKFDEAKRELQRLRERRSEHPRVAIVQAAIAQAEKKNKLCEETLQNYLAEHPGNEEVLLCLAQLYSQQNQTVKAVEALAQLPVKFRAQPGTLKAIASLYQKQKSPEKAIACIHEAVDYWASEDTTTDEETLASVFQIAARLAKQLKDEALAAEVYQLHLEKVDGSNVEALCGLVQALASTDVEKAEQYAERLKVPSYDHLDAEELEKAAIPKVGARRRETKDAAVASPGEGNEVGQGEDAAAAATVKPKKKRKRKIRYPKNFDPENPGPPPDPERWLPKHERSEFKKRMRKRDKQLARGPQGSMPVDDNAFRKQGPSTAQVEVAKDGTNRRNQGRKGNKKK
mmetsp:Transcript_53609/g.149138  ORF Transcript_53609/g.149138 Transcript_53609/m.149138 type:complete len:665 (-) Transcript_53609:128-2122(-)